MRRNTLEGMGRHYFPSIYISFAFECSSAHTCYSMCILSGFTALAYQITVFTSLLKLHPLLPNLYAKPAPSGLLPSDYLLTTFPTLDLNFKNKTFSICELFEFHVLDWLTNRSKYQFTCISPDLNCSYKQFLIDTILW